jgi:putative FmdB family regulatory protein
MPIYSYKCNHCGKVTSTYRSIEDRVLPEVCECGNLAGRSFMDERSNPQIFEPYFDEHLANDDYPNGRMCTGFRQKAKMMKEMGFEYYDKCTPDPATKREMEARRRREPLKKHFVGANKLKQRNIESCE